MVNGADNQLSEEVIAVAHLTIVTFLDIPLIPVSSIYEID